MELSEFGEKFTRPTGIMQLMHDLDSALGGQEKVYFLGGGNPGHISELEAKFRDGLQRILSDPNKFRNLIGIYDHPVGNQRFIRALSGLLKKNTSWDIGPENIALTNGSQNSFFYLFNMFAGRNTAGINKKILLPIVPEYIGYSDLGLSDEFFLGCPPTMHFVDDNRFEYRIDFERLEDWLAQGKFQEVGAIAISRPTNPTGNVVSRSELERLGSLAESAGVPLIIDAAYGYPFPDIIYDSEPIDLPPGGIITLSLSKFGLPAARTGIVIGPAEVIAGLCNINAVINLAGGGFGPNMALPLVEDGSILTLSKTIQGHYAAQRDRAEAVLGKALEQYPKLKGKLHWHVPQGAFFLWIWARDLPISAADFYEHLKKHQVIVVPGHYYFPGLDALPANEIPAEMEAWRRQCFRLSYSQNIEDVETGLEIFCRELNGRY